MHTDNNTNKMNYFRNNEVIEIADIDETSAIILLNDDADELKVDFTAEIVNYTEHNKHGFGGNMEDVYGERYANVYQIDKVALNGTGLALTDEESKELKRYLSEQLEHELFEIIKNHYISKN